MVVCVLCYHICQWVVFLVFIAILVQIYHLPFIQTVIFNPTWILPFRKFASNSHSLASSSFCRSQPKFSISFLQRFVCYSPDNGNKLRVLWSKHIHTFFFLCEFIEGILPLSMIFIARKRIKWQNWIALVWRCSILLRTWAVLYGAN